MVRLDLQLAAVCVCVLGDQLQGRHDEVTEGCGWLVCTGYHGEAR